jgi:hypothetical protein
MSETKWTPGPWEIRRSKLATDGAFDYAVSAGDVPVIAEAFGRDAHGGWPPAEANAHLIAAAPDLYAALVAALEYVALYESEHMSNKALAVHQKGRAALARARGEKT